MARGRMIDKVVILSKKINAISEGAENLYYRVNISADDYGRYHAEPEILKGQIYTLRKIRLAEIFRRVDELWGIELIKIYAVNGEKYLEIIDFEKHQTFKSDRPKKAECPEPKEYLKRGDGIQVEPDGIQVEPDGGLSKDKLSKDKLREGKLFTPPSVSKQDEVTAEEKKDGPPPKWIKQALEEIPKIFRKYKRERLLEDKTFFDYLIMLTWEFKDLDSCEEIEGKLTHWIKKPPTEKSNLCLQFRIWFKNARKWGEETKRERAVGKPKEK
jgi:hypothetical protein